MRYGFVVLLIFPSVLSARVKMRHGQRVIDPPIWTPSAGQLTELTATLPGSNIRKLASGDYMFPSTTVIHEAIKCSPEFVSLNLRLAMLGCTGAPDRWSLPFSLRGGDTYPPMEHLCLERYSFWHSEFQDVGPPRGFPLWDSYPFEWQHWFWSGDARQWWEWRKMPETQRLKTNAELWAAAMDWSRLESLELRQLDGSEFIKHISPGLTGLRELILDDFQSNDTSAWLTTLRPLQKLVWLGCCSIEQVKLDAVLEQHGSTLENLEIHPLRISWRGPFLQTSQIQKIGQMAPKLKRLAVAVQRNGTWPFDALEAVSSMPQLEVAEIWMEYVSEEGYKPEHNYLGLDIFDIEIEVDAENERDALLYQKPLFNLAGVTKLWEFMKEASGHRLQSVAFRAGDFTRDWDGPLYSPRWSDRQRVNWVCDSEGCQKSEGRRDIFEIQNEVDYERYK